MVKVLLTGSGGFIGRNLGLNLARRDGVEVFGFDVQDSAGDLERSAGEADVVFHLAGVNRPEDPGEFESGNAGFTRQLCQLLRDAARRPHVIVSSSIQAERDNPYGTSKRHAEQVLAEFAEQSGATVSIFRLKNVFGKWCRPNYNSVVATFCHNIAHDLPIQISDPANRLELVYIDDVVQAMLDEMDNRPQRPTVFVEPDPIPSTAITLGELADRIRMFRGMQDSLQIPDFAEPFNRQLYATYLSYVPPERWEYGPPIRSDERGNLAELVKSPHFGQIFVSRTKPGVTRGNHYHHTKTEKFIVIAGQAVIRFRQIEGTQIQEFPVKGEDYRIIEIPPGYTHSIENTGADELVTLFWASEVFDAGRADTWWEEV